MDYFRVHTTPESRAKAGKLAGEWLLPWEIAQLMFPLPDDTNHKVARREALVSQNRVRSEIHAALDSGELQAAEPVRTMEDALKKLFYMEHKKWQSAQVFNPKVQVNSWVDKETGRPGETQVLVPDYAVKLSAEAFKPFLVKRQSWPVPVGSLLRNWFAELVQVDVRNTKAGRKSGESRTRENKPEREARYKPFVEMGCQVARKQKNRNASDAARAVLRDKKEQANTADIKESVLRRMIGQHMKADKGQIKPVAAKSRKVAAA